MKDWLTTSAISAALSVSLALAEDFKTINGKDYKDAIISRIEPDGIVLRMKSGIVKLYFSELPQEVQERLNHADVKAAASNIPYQTPTKEVEPPKLSAAIAKLQTRGLLRIDCIEPDAKAWIAAGSWKTWDAQEKENVTKNLAEYCHPQHPSIWILDKESGRRLASYDRSGRFEVY